jgi:hypothetical protein
MIRAMALILLARGHYGFVIPTTGACRRRVLGPRGGEAPANALYNATGVRVREFPITLDKLLPRLPL